MPLQDRVDHYVEKFSKLTDEQLRRKAKRDGMPGNIDEYTRDELIMNLAEAYA